jgi:heptosyltransferase-2
MPGVRKALVSDLPRGRLALARQRALAERLHAEHYGTALIMPRTWKSALVPFLAGIPERTGFFGEVRVGLINDMRWGERALARMIDRCSALALPKGAPLPTAWPLPQLVVPDAEVAAWRVRAGIDERTAVAVCPGAVGAGKSWPLQHYAALARRLTADGIAVWVLGAPNERPLAQAIVAEGGALVRDLTGPLRDNVFALKAAAVAVTNDSGLLHVAAAIGTPAVAIFGPTDPREHAPLNPVAAIIEPEAPFSERRRTADVAVVPVEQTVRAVLGRI